MCTTGKVIAAAFAVFAVTAWAQQPIIYPAKGQSPSQQNADTGQCNAWAKQSTGVDPAQVAYQLSNQRVSSPQPQGERVIGAAGGALIGGAIGGGNAAVGGALVGTMMGGARQRKKQNQASQQQSQNQQYAQSQLSTYNRAVAACMESRGYTVR
jgi:uncharacterized protein YcfJ